MSNLREGRELIPTNNPEVCSEVLHLDDASDHYVITGPTGLSFNRKKIIRKQITHYKEQNMTA